jgi:hypothetical protein
MGRPPTYRFVGPRWALVSIGAHALGLVGLCVAYIVATQNPRSDGGVFVILLLGYAVICWLNLFRTAYELQLEAGVVRWRAPLRSSSG